jgi:ribosomal protein S18 acetylase RimI-like enzyme
MIVEAAHESDIEEIAALVNSAYRGESSRMGWTTEADLLSGQRVDAAGLRADLSLKPAAMVLTMRASAGEEILACVWLEQAGPDHFYLGMLAVRPTLQAGGLGRALLEEAEGRAKAAGARAMQLTVIGQRDALIAWYERRGYARTGVIKPFPYGAPRVGEPRRLDLRLVELEKPLRA